MKLVTVNKFLLLITVASLSGTALAGSSSGGVNYTNFGMDLTAPIFPKNGTLKLFKNKSDDKPLAELHDLQSVSLNGDDFTQSCLGKSTDGWVRCYVGGKIGWVRRADFQSGGEFQPLDQWPLRYWLYIASDGFGSEETQELLKAARHSPYLSQPKEFANIFFKVRFDREGFALNDKTGKKTGDRVFVVGKSVYLAPADAAKRDRATWLFLNYYDAQRVALCPSTNEAGCDDAVNLSPSWRGIKSFYSVAADSRERSPSAKESAPSFGAGEVAFARFSDPVTPLMYTVPDLVSMAADPAGATAPQRRKNREKQFCLMDCKP
jgi:hypothetical protein